MSKRIKQCILCGKEYEYCGKCAQFATAPKWMRLYDSENCMNVFNAVSEYYAGAKPEDVKKALKECDLKNKDAYKQDVKEALNAIYAAK